MTSNGPNACTCTQSPLTKNIIRQGRNGSTHVFVQLLNCILRYCDFLFTRKLRSGICYRNSVCRPMSSVTSVHPTQPVEIFHYVFLRHFVSQSSVDLYAKFYKDRPRGTPPSGLKRKKGSQICWIFLFWTSSRPMSMYVSQCNRSILGNLSLPIRFTCPKYVNLRAFNKSTMFFSIKNSFNLCTFLFPSCLFQTSF